MGDSFFLRFSPRPPVLCGEISRKFHRREQEQTELTQRGYWNANKIVDRLSFFLQLD